MLRKRLKNKRLEDDGEEAEALEIDLAMSDEGNKALSLGIVTSKYLSNIIFNLPINANFPVETGIARAVTDEGVSLYTSRLRKEAMVLFALLPRLILFYFFIFLCDDYFYIY